MADLSSIERRKLERLFRMGGGYVLDFSDRTFSEFFEEHTRRDIDAAIYRERGTSKANRLRGFWAAEGNHLVGKVIQALIQYGQAEDCLGNETGLTDLTDDCWKIAARMLNDTPVAELDALTATADERDFETVAQHVREAIDKNQPEAALDRLHTFVIKYLRPTMAHDLFSFDSSVLLVRDVAGDYRPADADEVLQAAQRLLGQQLRGLEVLSSPQVVRDFLRVKLGSLEHEVFAVLMLDAQHRLIEYVELFHGMVSQTSVYPREVVKESQARNVAALVLAHNHPSGVAEPSLADEHLTQTLKSALSLVDVRLLDHAMAAGRDVRSLAELDLLRPVNAVNGVRQ